MRTDMGHKHLVVVKGPFVSAAAMSVWPCNGRICLPVRLSSDMSIALLTVSFVPPLFPPLFSLFNVKANVIFVPELPLDVGRSLDLRVRVVSRALGTCISL